MTKTNRPHRGLILAVILLVAAILPQGVAGFDKSGHCVFPDGTDLNEVWGVSEPIVWFQCTKIPSGRAWRVAEGWGMNATFEQVPDGFVPAGTTPQQDFLAKFVGVKVIVDPGTRHERQYSFTDVDKLLVGDGTVNGVTMGTMDPLRSGRHVVEAYWSMSAMHCDGFSTVVEVSCLLAGDSLAFATEFKAVGNRHRGEE